MLKDAEPETVNIRKDWCSPQVWFPFFCRFGKLLPFCIHVLFVKGRSAREVLVGLGVCMKAQKRQKVGTAVSAIVCHWTDAYVTLCLQVLMRLNRSIFWSLLTQLVLVTERMPLRLDIKKKLSARMLFKFFRVVNFWYRGIQGLLHRGAALGSLSCSCGRSDRVKCVDFHPSEPWTLSALYSGSAVFATIF